MINIFQLADNDQSIYYLGEIFGNVGMALSGTGSPLLSVMFKVFNTALLALGALMVAYVTIVGVMATAHEGEFLGKKWHSLWVPIRTVAGIAALFPTGSGYCGIQIVFMWIIVQGIAAADVVWSTTVDYMTKSGVITAAPPPATDAAGQLPQAIKSIFAGLVCQSFITKINANDENKVAHSSLCSSADPDNGNPPTQCSTSGGSGTPVAYGFGRSLKPGEQGADPSAICGYVAWNASLGNNKPVDPNMRAALQQAIQSIVPTLELIADNLVKQAINDPNCWSSPPCPPGITSSGCYFKKYLGLSLSNNSQCIINNPTAAANSLFAYAGSNFVTNAAVALQGYGANYANSATALSATNTSGSSSTNIGNPTPSGTNQTYTRARANGWIFAGAFYYYIANNNNSSQGNLADFIQLLGNGVNQYQAAAGVKSSKPPVGMTPYDTNNPAVNQYTDLVGSNAVPATANIYTMAQSVADGINTAAMNAASAGGGIGAGSGAATEGGGGEGSGPASAMSSVAFDTMHHWMTMIAPANSTQNPIVTIQSFGESLLIAAEVLFWVFFAVVLLLGFAQTKVYALGFTLNWGEGIAGAVLLYLIPIVFFLLAYLITIGALFGIYVPLIPYMLFAFGVIGWFIACIEAMIAAPIVALGMMSPGGQHEILGRAEPATMILLNLFLRPTLMVFGMMSGMLLSYVVIQFINAAFYNVVASIIGGTSMGLIEVFLFIMAYAGLVVTALNKCFSLIYLIPDKTLRWIGAQAETYGEAEALEQVKGKIHAGGEAATGAAKGVGGQGASSAQSGVKRMQRKGEKKHPGVEGHKKE